MRKKKRLFEEKRREERLRPKFVQEITAATTLIQYLQSLQNQALRSSARDSVDSTETTLSGEVPQGAILLKSKAQRDSEEAYFTPKPKATKQKQTKPETTTKKSDALTFSLNIIDEFMMLQVALPSTSADIERALEQLQEKKTFYEGKQKEEHEKALKEVEEENAAEARGEKTETELENTEDATGDNFQVQENDQVPEKQEQQEDQQEPAEDKKN